jgi:hypothetical protein
MSRTLRSGKTRDGAFGRLDDCLDSQSVEVMILEVGGHREGRHNAPLKTFDALGLGFDS